MDQLNPQFVIYLVLIVSLLSYILSGSRRRIFEHMKNLIIWICFFFLVLAAYSYKTSLMNFLAPLVSELSPGRPIVEDQTLVYKKSLDGHFHINANINGIPIEFLVDTGASDVTLTLGDALKIGINTNELVFNKQYDTANGMVRGASISVDITIEHINFPNFPVSVNSGSMGKSLMGMSLLSQFSEVAMDKDELRLKFRND